MIRRAVPADRPWIQQIAAGVYRDLGDYGTIIPSWLEHPGVLAYIEESGMGERRGFILLGFYEPGGVEPGLYVADLLALAVAPEHQRRGVGRALLGYAIQVARLAGRQNRVSEIRLTVAESNDVGQHLYVSSGFRILDEDHGAYDGGQRAIRMARRLP